MGLFWPKYIILGLFFMTKKSDTKFEKKTTCGLKNSMRDLTNFHQSTWKCQNLDFDGIFLLKGYDPKI